MEVPGKRQKSDDEENAENNNKICEPCQSDKNITPANGFCKDCWEFMCYTCFRQHLKGKLCRHHELVGSDLSQLSIQSDERKTSCKQHDGETVKFYCRTHEVVGCGDCMIRNHNDCKSEFIKDLSVNFRHEKEYKTLKGNIEKLISEKKEVDKEIQDHQKDNKLMLDKALEDIRQFRLDINEYLDKVEADIISEVKVVMRQNETLLNKLENDGKALSTKLEKITAMLNSGLFKDTLFIHAVECKPKVPEIDLVISDMKSKTMKKYEFVPDTQLRGLSALVKKLGTLSISTSPVCHGKTYKDGKLTLKDEVKETKAVSRKSKDQGVTLLGKDQDIVFETFHHRSGKEFQCIYQSGMRFYLDDLKTKEWQPFPKRWYNEGLLVTNTLLRNEEKSEEANRASEQSQVSKKDQRQRTAKEDDREGFLMHPTKGKLQTYIFYKRQKVHMYFDQDTGSWEKMPISWELHHDMVKSLVDQVDKAVPTWGDRHDILALLRACNYDPDECISIYSRLEGDVWMKKPLNRQGSQKPQSGKDDGSKV